ncbi:hypothetical protein AMD27_06865 [Acinetobacter sp. TGL-Y2]|uniref:hypothetical protein n=1 Tax=Acinetobacter sp. TGL-Y2 TaxID=1407071 RepID=UPI0007A675BA|nr:hypothetical protein [Acinetobacter sp. TGL-Y2]AMW80362.1 hypothetical protein AMD27_06865 [Acinetobacter sp. TGL-Y2]
MKSTPDQAIYDFSCAIYRIAKMDYEIAGQPIIKDYFLMRCLILIGELKQIEAHISTYNETIQYVVDENKYTFWLVETPEPNEQIAFLDYLTKEITAIFYNLNPDDCIR